MSAEASQNNGRADHISDRPGIQQFNTNTVWAREYIRNKGFALSKHVIRLALVDIARDGGFTNDGKVVYDDPRDDGIAV